MCCLSCLRQIRLEIKNLLEIVIAEFSEIVENLFIIFLLGKHFLQPLNRLLVFGAPLLSDFEL